MIEEAGGDTGLHGPDFQELMYATIKKQHTKLDKSYWKPHIRFCNNTHITCLATEIRKENSYGKENSYDQMQQLLLVYSMHVHL